MVPLFEHFGSEELTALAGPIRLRTPAPYAVLSASDAAAIGVSQGERLRVTVGGETMLLELRIAADFPSRSVGISVGLVGVVPVAAGAACTVGRGEAA
jgi:NADH-quinone oxidoreductase subunit G